MKRACFLPMALLMLAACASTTTTTAQPPPASPSASAAKPADLFPPIKALIGDARCETDQQCRTIGVGHKACGGPGGYLAWSTLSTPDEAALRSAVDKHALAEKEAQERAGMLSNCMAVPDPGARCVAKTCRLNERPGAGAR